MLHLIVSSTFEIAIVERLKGGDDVVFLQSAIWLGVQGNRWSKPLQEIMNNNCRVHVLADDLQIFGLQHTQMLAGINVVSYEQLVSLTEDHQQIYTWR